MLQRLTGWLGRNKPLNYFIVSAYFIFVIFMHDPFVNLSVWAMNLMERHLYDKVVAGIFMVLLSTAIFFFIKNILQNPGQRRLKIFFLIATVAMILVHTQVMFVMNIEIIHSFQYGILAILIFPLSWRFGNAVYWAALLGVIDEWYQYQILYPGKNDYFDFNDVVMNLLGAGMAAVMLFGIKEKLTGRPKPFQWTKSPVVISAILIVAGIYLLIHFSLIQVYGGESASGAWLTLSKAMGPEPFWRSLPNSDIIYHVMQPLEGTVAVVFLLGFYFLMDIFSKKEQQLT